MSLPLEGVALFALDVGVGLDIQSRGADFVAWLGWVRWITDLAGNNCRALP